MKNIVNKFQDNHPLETEIAQAYAPIIAKKIYYECAQSFSDVSPSQPFQGSSIYTIASANPELKEVYSIHIDNNFCDCLKTQYLGIPCRHIICGWRYLSKDIMSSINETVSSFWQMECSREDNVPNHNHNRSVRKLVNIAPNRSQWRQDSEAQTEIIQFSTTNEQSSDFLGQCENKLNNSEKKKKRSHSKITPSTIQGLEETKIVSHQMKKVKRNEELCENVLFSFLKNKEYSCPRNVILALFSFLVSEDKALYLKIREPKFSHLYEAILKVQDMKLEEAGNSLNSNNLSLIDKNNKITSQSLLELLTRIIGKHINLFNTKFKEKRACTNTEYRHKHRQKTQTEGPFISYDIPNVADDDFLSKSLVEGFFEKFYLNSEETLNCVCNQEFRHFPKITISN